MNAGLVFLVLAYVFSQFYRAFLAVLTPFLETDLGAGADDLSLASGLWFLAFAIMQIPVGWALDTLGPRRTSALLFAFGAGGGALVFGFAQSPIHISLAMVLIGIGCAPVLMASYYIFARVYSPAVFATLAGAIIGIGSLGNIAGAAPMVWVVEAFGWRETMFALSGVTWVIAAAILVLVQDPERVVTDQKGSVLDLLKIPALWLIFPLVLVNYAPSAGLRGLWAGPYATDVFGADAGKIGQMTLIMALAMVVGNFAYGPLDRVFGTRKWVIVTGNSGGAVCCLILWMFPMTGFWTTTILFAAIGLFGASFAVMVAHARSFFPAHLMGRGVTLVNLFGIGGVGLAQVITGRIHTAVKSTSDVAVAPYSAIFLYFGAALVVGLAIYLFSQDRTD